MPDLLKFFCLHRGASIFIDISILFCKLTLRFYKQNSGASCFFLKSQTQ